LAKELFPSSVFRIVVLFSEGVSQDFGELSIHTTECATIPVSICDTFDELLHQARLSSEEYLGKGNEIFSTMFSSILSY
jgi:hypothetical protein